MKSVSVDPKALSKRPVAYMLGLHAVGHCNSATLVLTSGGKSVRLLDEATSIISGGGMAIPRGTNTDAQALSGAMTHDQENNFQQLGYA